MPNDPYQISDTDSGITLVLADRGTAVAIPHAASHVTGGADAIREASASPLQNGLMPTAYVTKLEGVAPNADVTSAASIATAMVAAGTATPVGADSIGFFDVSGPNLFKTATLTDFTSFLGQSLVRLEGTQSITGTKTFTNAVFTTATINGGSVNASINLGTNVFVGQLPVASGGTGVGTKTGTGSVVLSNAPTLTSPTLNTPDLGIPSAGDLQFCSNLPLTGTTGTLTVARGGTGATTFTAGVLRSSGGTNALSTGPVALATEVSGVLPVAYGGTGFAQNPYGQLSGQTAAATANIVSSSYSKLNIDTDIGSPNNLFDDGSPADDNVLRYTGSVSRNFLISASADVLGSTSGVEFAIRIAKGTTTIPQSQCNATASGAGTNHLAKLATSWIVTLGPNESVSLFIAVLTAAGTGTPQRMKLVATPV